MRHRSPTLLAALLVALLSLALPAPASALTGDQIAQKVLVDFSVDGALDPCKHTSEELKLVLKFIPADIAQYAPDYPAAVSSALKARARGDCAGKKPSTTPVVPVPTQAPVASPTPVPTAIPTKTVVPDPPEPERAPADAGGTFVKVNAAKPDAQLQRVATATPANAAPAPLLLLAILAALLALSALFLVVMRRFGWGDERLAAPRHTLREASWRAGGAWEDFRDWLRLGR